MTIHCFECQKDCHREDHETHIDWKCPSCQRVKYTQELFDFVGSTTIVRNKETTVIELTMSKRPKESRLKKYINGVSRYYEESSDHEYINQKYKLMCIEEFIK
jgi:phage FluMu protein Com